MPTILLKKKPPKQDWSLFVLIVMLLLVLGAIVAALCARGLTIPAVAPITPLWPPNELKLSFRLTVPFQSTSVFVEISK